MSEAVAETERTLWLDPTSLIPCFHTSLRMVAYGLRAVCQRITKETVGEFRAKNRGVELTDAVSGEYRHGYNATAWFSAIAQRFGIYLAGDGDGARVIALRLPEGMLLWPHAMRLVDRRHLAHIVEHYAHLVVAFAVGSPSEGEDAVLTSIEEPVETAKPWIPRVPKSLLVPGRFSAVLTQVDPLSHGADQKTGNTLQVRHEPRVDLLTGTIVEVPLISGNSWRGVLRDALFLDMLERIGLRACDLPPAVSHGLLSGGVVESGADTAQVDIAQRERWRRIVPAWSLLGGCQSQQVMSGYLRVTDLTPVCRETAVLVQPHIAPELDAQELAERLPTAHELSTSRQLIRSGHRDLPGDSGQMLVRQQLVISHVQWVHSVGFARLDVGPVEATTRGALAHGIELMRGTPIGGGGARGFGGMVFDDYLDPAGQRVGDASAWLQFIEANGDAIRALLVDVAEAATKAPTPKASKGGRGSSKRRGADAPVAADTHEGVEA